MISTPYNDTEEGILSTTKKPKIGFLGLGWIGKNRLEAIRKSGLTDVVALCDPFVNETDAYCKANSFKNSGIYENLLDEDLDGIVIATPSALHKEHAMKAMQRGMSVFCQKPLACNLEQTKALVDLAREKDLLLMADMSYRYTEALMNIKKRIDAGELGDVFAAHLTFHNAYGPDKSWYYDPALSGGGCVMDLGVHLIDALFWMFPALSVRKLSSRLLSKGIPIKNPAKETEDYSMVHIDFTSGFSAQVNCSWNLSAGRDAVIELQFYGTKGGASFSNINGYFYDFKAELFKGTKSQILSAPPDDWGGKAAIHWATLLAEEKKYKDNTADYLKTAETLDLIYGR